VSGYAIRILSHWLDLYPDQAVTITRENGMFSDTVLPGLTSFPISLPVTTRNVKAFGNIHNLAVFNWPEKITGAYFYLEGRLEAVGTIIINTVSPTRFDITFTEWDSAAGIGDTTLHEIEWPEYDVTTDPNVDVVSLPAFHTQLVNRVLNGVNEDGVKDFVAPTVVNNSATATTAWEFFHIWDGPQHSDTVSHPFQNIWKDNAYAILLGTRLGSFYAYLPNAISLFCYANWIMKKTWEHLGFNITYSRLTLGDFENLLIYSNRAICLFNMDEAVGMGNGLYDPRKIRFYEDTFRVKEFLPKMTILKFLEAFQKTFNLRYVINHERSEVRIECRNDKITSPIVRDISRHAFSYESWKTDNAAKYTGLEYQREGLADTKYIYKGEVDTILELPITGNADKDMYYITEEYSGYSWNNITKAWEKLFTNETNGVQNLNTAKDGAISIGADVADNNQYQTITQQYGDYNEVDGTFNASAKTGVVNKALTTQKAITDLQPQDNTNEDITFLLYRGIPEGYNMPIACIDGEFRNGFGDIATEWNSSLEMFGPKGLYNTFHKAWMNFCANARPVTMRLNIPVYKLNQVMQDFVRISGQQFLITKATITATPARITNIKAEMLQQKPGA